jgi:hypothetical protein
MFLSSCIKLSGNGVGTGRIVITPWNRKISRAQGREALE